MTDDEPLLSEEELEALKAEALAVCSNSDKTLEAIAHIKSVTVAEAEKMKTQLAALGRMSRTLDGRERELNLLSPRALEMGAYISEATRAGKSYRAAILIAHDRAGLPRPNRARLRAMLAKVK